MYRIGICDDDKELCSGLEEQIYQITKDLKVKADVEVWYSGEGIRKDIGNGTRLDLLFLDIELVRENGISVGKFISYIFPPDKIMPCSYSRSSLLIFW